MPLIPHASESALFERGTGVIIRQVTSHPSNHHHPFFFVEAWDAAMSFLLLISHRTGRPQIFIEPAPGQDLIQLTEEPALAEWSVISSRDGRWIYFVAGQEGKRVSPRDGTVETLAHFGSKEMREAGMVGAAMGTTALSACGRYWAVPVKSGAVSHFWMIDTARQRAEIFLEAPTPSATRNSVPTTTI